MTLNLILGMLGMQELLIIALIVLLLFGGKKIPELMRGMGKGVSSFKKGMSEVQDEINKPVEDDEVAQLNRRKEEQRKEQN